MTAPQRGRRPDDGLVWSLTAVALCLLALAAPAGGSVWLVATGAALALIGRTMIEHRGRRGTGGRR